MCWIVSLQKDILKSWSLGMWPYLEIVLLTPWFWTCGLQDCEKIHLCCFQPPLLGTLCYSSPMKQIHIHTLSCNNSSAGGQWWGAAYMYGPRPLHMISSWQPSSPWAGIQTSATENVCFWVFIAPFHGHLNESIQGHVTGGREARESTWFPQSHQPAPGSP